jgi:hypothetical protein
VVLFDVSFAFVAAAGIGWRADGGCRDLALFYVGAGVCVPGLAFLERYPAWDVQYFVDPGALPVGTSAAFALAVLVAGAAGHWVGSQSARAVYGAAGLLALYGVVTLPRTLAVGDMAAWTAGTAEILPLHFLQFAAPWMVASGALLAWTLYRVERARE